MNRLLVVVTVTLISLNASLFSSVCASPIYVMPTDGGPRLAAFDMQGNVAGMAGVPRHSRAALFSTFIEHSLFVSNHTEDATGPFTVTFLDFSFSFDLGPKESDSVILHLSRTFNETETFGDLGLWVSVNPVNVPEPTALYLLGIGLLGIVALRWLRNAGPA